MAARESEALDLAPSYNRGVLALVSVVASVAAAFTAAPQLAQRMQPIAGKEIAVYCASSSEVWRVYLAAMHAVPDAAALTPAVGGTETFLSERTCDTLERRVAGRSMSLRRLGVDLFTLAHEVEHLRGVADEHAADCAALQDMPGVARAFGIRDATKIARLLRFLRLYHALSPPPYGGPCP